MNTKSAILNLITAAVVAAVPFTVSANPDRENAKQVDDVTVAMPGIQINHVVLKVVNNAIKPDLVVIGATKSSMKIHLEGYVRCSKKTNFHSSYMHFGIAHRTSQNGLNETDSLYKAPFSATVAIWAGINGWVTENSSSSDFTIPLNKAKLGPASVAFNPIIEFKKKMKAYVENGGNKAKFLREDYSFSVQKEITLAAKCRDEKSPHTSGWGTHTITVPISIKYEGNPNVKDGAQTNANSNQLMAPFIVNSAKVVPLQTNPKFDEPSKLKFRLSIKASGAGLAQYRLVEKNGGKIHVESEARNLSDGKSGGTTFFFTVPQKETS